MTELELSSGAGAPNATAEGRAATGMPRWVPISLIFVVVGVVLLVVVPRLTGMGGGQQTSGGHRHEEASAVAKGSRRIAVTADGFQFDPDEISVKAGEDIAIVLTSRDVVHDFVIDELDAHVSVGAGDTATGGFRAERPGRYSFYCSEPGHRGQGMEGTLTVTRETRGDTEARPRRGVDHGDHQP